jgi:hypothetical protein
MRRTTPVISLLSLTILLAACGGDDAPAAVPVIDPGDGGDYHPAIEPADFVDRIDNPYLPLGEGARWVYEGDADGGGRERIEVVVTGDRREVMGVATWVVRDTVSVDGEITEDTYDWFAQDRDGTVWYFGEDSREFEDGVAVRADGSWEAGIDGALPGIVMPAEPAPGLAYRQEFDAGNAEDMGEILEVGVSRSTGAASYTDVVVTEDWTPLDPETVEEKWYARGVGNIRSTHTAGEAGTVELLDHVPGS